MTDDETIALAQACGLQVSTMKLRNAVRTFAEKVWAVAQSEPAAVHRWRPLADEMPEPECFVLTWDGRLIGIDWWGSLRYRRGDDTTHWCPFPKPPGAGGMYGLHSVATTSAAGAAPEVQAVIDVAEATRPDEKKSQSGWGSNGPGRQGGPGGCDVA